MRFETMNPLGAHGSSDPRDLYDNAGIADLLVNGPLGEYLSRLGVPLKSWRGIMQQISDYLLSMGFEAQSLIYSEGVVVLRQTQLVERSGELFKVRLAGDIPLSLTGDWAADSSKLQAVGDAALRQALGSNEGASMIGYVRDASEAGTTGRRVGDVLQERINVKDFVVAGGNAGGGMDSWAAIQSAIDYVESLATTISPPYKIPTIWLPFDVYGISKPLRCKHAIKFDGDDAKIKALPGFTPAIVPAEGGGTATDSSMILFLNGNKGSTTGQVRWWAQVGRGITLDCSNIAYPGVYMERMAYSNINCRVLSSPHNCVEIGPWCWGANLDEITLEDFTDNGIAFLPNAAANGTSIKNPRIWGRFQEGYCGINFLDGSECNGVEISGGFIEKLKYGSLIGMGNGPIKFSGVDFEQCAFGNIRAVGDLAGGRRVGPVDVENCFLHTIIGPKIYSDRAVINVSGCRMFPGTLDFETDLSFSGVITARNNEYPGGVVGLTTGANVVVEQHSGYGKSDSNYLSHKAADFRTGYALRNYQYRDSPFMQSSGLDFKSFYVGGAAGQYVGMSDWWVSEYQHGMTPGVITKTIGVRLANDSGQNSFEPMLDNATSCGRVGARFSFLAAGSATIVTSDRREKQQIRDISEVEKAVAGRLKSLLKAFRFNDAVLDKGDGARIHFGVIAQDVKAAFEAEGLIAEDYALLCFDEWGETFKDVEEVREEVLTTEPTRMLDLRGRPIIDNDGNEMMHPPGQRILDASGNPTTKMVRPAERIKVQDAGNRYGIRYEELIVFMLSNL